MELSKEQATKHESAVDDFRRWNEEAVARCVLFTPQVGYSFTSVFVSCILMRLACHHDNCVYNLFRIVMVPPNS